MTAMEKKYPPILIVDDNPENIAVLFNFLTKHNLEALIAQDGESALQAATAEHPCLILLDVLMSDLDGFETCKRFKADPQLREIPIIFITALADTASKVKGFELGGIDYITKPFELEEVFARVKTHLTIYSLHQELRAKEEILAQATQKLEALATIDALTGLANQRGFYERLQQEWHHSCQQQLPLSLIRCEPTDGEQLRQVAKVLSQAVKPALVSRYEEAGFAVILPNTPAPAAMQVATHIQQAVAVTLGISSTLPTSHQLPETLIDTANQALAEAKDSHCIVIKSLA